MTDTTTAARIPFLRVRHETAPAPSACRWCGEEERTHANTWVRSVGYHQWVAPTSAQRRARILARMSRKVVV